MKLVVCLLSVLVTRSSAYPASQPVYSNPQYISAQAIPNVQYRQHQQPQAYLQPAYISAVAAAAAATATQTAKPIYEDKGAGLQKYSTQIKQPIQQVVLPTTVDRQIQRVALQQQRQPLYLQQYQSVQAQPQPQQAHLSRPVQISAPQAQYLRESGQTTQVKFLPPAAAGYRGPPQQGKQALEQENSEDYDPNPSYQFGFDVNDDLYTNYQNRKEQREGNKITGSYSVVDSDGFVRTVKYTADPKEGFKAEVTRQPTDIVVKIPKPDPQYQNLPEQKVPQQYTQNRQIPDEGAYKSNLAYQYQ